MFTWEVIRVLPALKDRLNRNRIWVIDIACLGVLFIIFYTLWLGTYPVFTPEEGRYSEVAREMVTAGDYITPRINGVTFLDKPILHYWLQAAAINLFGVQEWALRLFPALFGVLGTLMLYICGSCLFNRRTGLLATIILATSPLYFGGAHYANLDLEVAVLISCTLLCLITSFQLHDKTRLCFLFAAYIFSALAFLTKGLIGIVFPAMITGIWIITLRRFSLLKKIHLVFGILLFIAIVSPWYMMMQKANPKFLEYFFITQQVTRFLSSGEFNNKTPLWFYIPIVLIGFFPWAIFLIQAFHKSFNRIWHAHHAFAIDWFLLLWVGIIFIFFSIPQSKTMGYILPIFPPLALLVGNYLANMWENTQQKVVYWGALNFIIMGSTLSAILLIVSQTKLTGLPEEFLPYLSIISLFYIIGIIISFFLLQEKSIVTLVHHFLTFAAFYHYLRSPKDAILLIHF